MRGASSVGVQLGDHEFQNPRERTSQFRARRLYGCAVQILESREEMAARPQGGIYYSRYDWLIYVMKKGPFLLFDETYNYSVQSGL